MDSYFLKLTGKAELPQAISIGHNFRVLAEGSIVSEEISDNDDGFKNHGYKFQPVKLEAITETGKTIKAKDTRSDSKLWHAQMYVKWKEADVDMDSDEFYHLVCSWERRNADFIVAAALKELKK
jgi:hypothetical protein